MPKITWKTRANTGWQLLKATATEWDKDEAPRLGAALAYYTVFSLAPLLVVAVAIAGLVWGQEAVQGQLSYQLTEIIGKTGADAVQAMVANAWQPSSGVFATVLGVVTLFLAGTAVFTELRAVLNDIWDVKPKKMNSIWAFIKARLLSFAMIGTIGFLLLVSLLVNTLLAAAEKYFAGRFPLPDFSAQVLFAVGSFGVISLLFAAIYKVLPEEEIQWRDVWVGAAITSFLFSIGKFVIGLYLGRTSVTSAFGASGSLAVIMLWAYYSSLIFIFGAEFTHVYAKHRRSHSKRVPDRIHPTGAGLVAS